MSYDLMVFDPKAAPSGRAGFIEWYRQQMDEDDGQGYDDPETTTPELRAWFMEMITHFPPMNGRLASDEDSSRVTDYGIGQSLIYAAFAWSEARPAFKIMFELARKHRVGFFDISGVGGDVWMPAPEGQYVRVHDQSVDGGAKQW